MTYAEGFYRRGLVGTVFQFLVGHMPRQAQIEIASQVSVTGTCLWLIAALTLFVVAAARVKNHALSLGALAFAAFAFINPMWTTRAFDNGLSDWLVGLAVVAALPNSLANGRCCPGPWSRSAGGFRPAVATVTDRVRRHDHAAAAFVRQRIPMDDSLPWQRGFRSAQGIHPQAGAGELSTARAGQRGRPLSDVPAYPNGAVSRITVWPERMNRPIGEASGVPSAGAAGRMALVSDLLLHSRQPDERPWKYLLPTLALAFAARAAIALSGDFVLHPDEIMQYLEPAHRLVFGNGAAFWEYLFAPARGWCLGWSPGVDAVRCRGAR